MAEGPRQPRRGAGENDWRRRARQPRSPRSHPSPSDYEAPPTRHPVYGGQAHRQNNTAAYAAGFVVVAIVLVVFLFVGLQWATGTGRDTGLGSVVTPTPLSISPSPSASPNVLASPSPAAPLASPSPATQRTYVVKAGDNPGSIARQFGVSAAAVEQANNITNPSSLQIGQTLVIPDAPS